MDKETAISQIYQILEIANISVETLIETIKPVEVTAEEFADYKKDKNKPQKKSNKK